MNRFLTRWLGLFPPAAMALALAVHPVGRTASAAGSAPVVMAWGYNLNGQLGDDSTFDRGEPLWFTLPATNPWSRAIGMLADAGSYTLMVEATDEAGNTGEVARKFDITPGAGATREE